MRNLKLKKYYTSKCDTSLKAMFVQNSNQALGNKFNNLYFHAKS